MKKIRLYALFLASFITFSCSNLDETGAVQNNTQLKTNSSTRYVAEDFEVFGIKHNEGLDYFLQRFQNSTVSNPTEYKNLMINSSEGYALDFIAKMGGGDPTFAVNLIRYSEIERKNIDNNFYEDITKSEQISLQARTYLDRLHNLLFNINDQATLDGIIQNIRMVEEEAYVNQNINNKDLTIIYTASNIAKYSLVYWNDNYEKWELAFITKGSIDEPPHYSTFGSGKKTLRAIGIIAGMDVAGGVMGAVSTWAVNVLVPPPAGQAAYAGAIIGNAIRASGMAAAGMILDAIWGLLW